MKRCCMCRREKPETEFYVDRSTTDGLERRCKACRKELSQRYARSPRGRKRNREACKKYYAENREREKARKRAYYAEHREDILYREKFRGRWLS